MFVLPTSPLAKCLEDQPQASWIKGLNHNRHILDITKLAI